MFTSRKLTPHIGVEVTGIDLSKPVDDATKRQLRDLWLDGAVMVVRNQSFDPEQFQTFAAIFGDLMPSQVQSKTVPGHPLVGTISSRDLPMVDGKLHVRGENFHTDHSNFEAPPKATMLHAIELPSKGGDTQFVDVRQAFDELAEDLRQQVLKLYSDHVFQSSQSPRMMVALTPEERAKIPKAVQQPLVIRHPDSGRPALYLNTGRMEGIVGMEPTRAYALIDELYAHATQSRYEYRHVWKSGDVVIWDNRSVMHQANADFDPAEYRYLYRIMLQGEPLQAYASHQLEETL